MAKGRKAGGRQPGPLNKATVGAKCASGKLVNDPVCRAKLEGAVPVGR
jgi:hypothetical protein